MTFPPTVDSWRSQTVAAKPQTTRRIALVLSAWLACLFFAAPARAQEGWVANLKADPYGPQRFLAVDKSSQTFWMFEQKSPLQASTQLPCTTGKEPGTKWKEGDLKTPEGVYFIKERVTGGLDFNVYGDVAFPLNYPNPIDIINGRTGHGIWIHGRGQPITPNESKGCVVLNQPDLKQLDAQLVKRTLPVVIANEIHWSADAPAATKEAQEVIANTLEWAKAWSRKSDDFFAFHDAAKFSLAQGEPFNEFRDHKRQLFAKMPWIHVLLDDVHAMQGPDYWVTYFGQLYRSPIMSSEGVKRLYWQKNDQGRFVIVGMEYDEATIGLESKYLARIRGDITTMVEAWRQAWEKGAVGEYIDFYADNASQGDRRGKAAILEQKRQLWVGAKTPKKVTIKDVKLGLVQDGVQVEFIQEYASRDGLADKGRKKLVIAPVGDGWTILDEDWSKM